MNRFLEIMAALLLLVILHGCGGGSSSSDPEPTPELEDCVLGSSNIGECKL